MPPVSSWRLGLLRGLPTVEENLNPPSLLFASKLLLQRLEKVGSMSGDDEQESSHRRLWRGSPLANFVDVHSEIVYSLMPLHDEL